MGDVTHVIQTAQRAGRIPAQGIAPLLGCASSASGSALPKAELQPAAAGGEALAGGFLEELGRVCSGKMRHLSAQ